MMEWSENIKRRRKQRIQSIQQPSFRDPFIPTDWEAPIEPTPWKQKKSGKRRKKWIRRIMIQSIFSLMLLAVTYVVLQTPAYSDTRAHQVISEAFHRPFNFQGLTAWYEKVIGTNPNILPTFQSESSTPSIWKPPVTGTVILPFNQERNGVVLRTKKGAEVVAPTDAWVRFAGEKEGIGKTVILQNTNGKEIWLSLLESFQVEKQQWVKKGEVIGKVGEKKDQSMVYVAVKQDGKFINPIEVIPFE